jgi:hypothetical protein
MEMKAYLEELMDMKRSCTIRFRSVQGGVSEIRAHILKMDSVSGRDMIETDAGLTIGLDQIEAINDQKPGNYC